jgi:hypothetical protein
MLLVGALTVLAGAGGGALVDLALFAVSGGAIAQHNGQTIGTIVEATPPAIAILVDALSGNANRYDRPHRLLSIQSLAGPARPWPLRPDLILRMATEGDGCTVVHQSNTGPNDQESELIKDQVVTFQWRAHNNRLNLLIQDRIGADVVVDWSRAKLTSLWDKADLGLTTVANPTAADGGVTAYLGGLPNGQQGKALKSAPLSPAGIDLLLPGGTRGVKGAHYATIRAQGSVRLMLPLQTSAGWRTYGVTLNLQGDELADAEQP